ncbi:MAG: hypothetical protein ACK5HY_14195, partial [Parahaliea sp.]
MSITEMEYNRSVERDIPRLIFLATEDHPFAKGQIDFGVPEQQILRLRNRLEAEQVVKYFDSPDTLGKAVLASLANQLQLHDTHAAATLPVSKDPPRREDNPYRSLEAFQEEDAQWYFGREELVSATIARIYGLVRPLPHRPRLLAIIGPSGSGKSSFARAGLMARLRSQAGAGDKRITLRPGEHPRAELSRKMGEILGEGVSSLPLPRAALPGGDGKSLLLLVDQFEEVWSQCESEVERNEFIDALTEAADREGGPVMVLLTLRSDFLAQSQRHPRLSELIAKESVLVPAMSEADLYRAITEPARRRGYPLDEQTIASLISDTLGNAGALPLLQFALTRIWEGMAAGVQPADTLNTIGGVGGALAKAAEDAYRQLEPRQQDIARRAFLAMVHLGEGVQDTRRRVTVEQLRGGDSEVEVKDVLERFTRKECRFV